MIPGAPASDDPDGGPARGELASKVADVNLEGMDAATSAFWRLRLTTWGGPLWTPGDVEKVLREKGFADVRALPRPPGVPVQLTVGRRKPS